VPASAAASQDATPPVAEMAPTDRNAEVNFHGQKGANETHASRTGPQARLYRKGPGKEAKLYFMGHALMENRSGLIVDAYLTEASGLAMKLMKGERRFPPTAFSATCYPSRWPPGSLTPPPS
jgi:hypothetical protein